MTRPELKSLALDIVEGRVFGSWMVPEDRRHLLGEIFLLLKLGGGVPEDTAHFCGDYADAEPWSINGYPMFLKRCRVLSHADVAALVPLIERYGAMRAAWAEEDP